MQTVALQRDLYTEWMKFKLLLLLYNIYNKKTKHKTLKCCGKPLSVIMVLLGETFSEVVCVIKRTSALNYFHS